MSPKEATGQAEQRFLRAICDLAASEAKAPVSFREIQEYLSYNDDEIDVCCEFWTRRGAVEWPFLGHIALTHLGLARAVSMGTAAPTPRAPHW